VLLYRCYGGCRESLGSIRTISRFSFGLGALGERSIRLKFFCGRSAAMSTSALPAAPGSPNSSRGAASATARSHCAVRFIAFPTGFRRENHGRCTALFFFFFFVCFFYGTKACRIEHDSVPILSASMFCRCRHRLCRTRPPVSATWYLGYPALLLREISRRIILFIFDSTRVFISLSGRASRTETPLCCVLCFFS